MEEASPESRQWFDAIGEAVDALVFITEPGGRMHWANEYFREATGFGPEDFQFENPDNPFIHRDDLERVGKALASFATGDASRSDKIENRFVDRWGRFRWYRSVVSKVAWEGSLAFLVVAWPMHPDGDIETALRESEERYRNLVDNAEDGIVYLARDGHLHFFNRRFEEITGLGPVALGKSSFWDLVHEEERERIRGLIAESDMVRFETRIVVGDRERWIGVNARRLTEGQSAGLLLAIVRDVSDDKRLEAELRQSQKLESLGIMAGGIAHDYNNLMTSVLGNVSLALEVLEGGTEVSEMLTDAKVTAERAGDLSRAMLAYLGEAPAAPKPLDLAQLIRDMGRLLRSVVPRGIELEFESGVAGLSFIGDPAQVHQVLLNLVTNAADAIGRGSGSIRIATRRRVFERPTTDVWLPQPPSPGAHQSLLVQDDGCGMEDEVVARMFDPFYSTKGPGRGLGLSSVLGIVSAHQGALRIDTLTGRGTAIEVVFPERDSAALAPSKAPARVTARLAGAILFVDDEPALRRLGARALKKAGYDVRLAESGEAALAACDGSIAGIVLDRTMPGMGGDAAFAALRDAHPGLPIVLTSGLGRPDGIAGEQQCAFLAKPYTSGQLVEALQSVSDGE